MDLTMIDLGLLATLSTASGWNPRLWRPRDSLPTVF